MTYTMRRQRIHLCGIEFECISLFTKLTICGSIKEIENYLLGTAKDLFENTALNTVQTEDHFVCVQVQ